MSSVILIALLYGQKHADASSNVGGAQQQMACKRAPQRRIPTPCREEIIVRSCDGSAPQSLDTITETEIEAAVLLAVRGS